MYPLYNELNGENAWPKREWLHLIGPNTFSVLTKYSCALIPLNQISPQHNHQKIGLFWDMTLVIYHFHLINSIRIIIRTMRWNKDAKPGAPNSQPGCWSCVWALVLICMIDVERLTALLLWPFTLSITQSSSHRLAPFHLLTLTPVPRLVLISKVCSWVYGCVHKCLSACKTRWERI